MLLRLRGFFGFLLLSFYSFNSYAVQDCKKIHFADVGWTDITASTALASVILEALGYGTKTSMLSLPMTYASLKNRDIDVFLGNWMPTMAADIGPYQANGSVETLSTLLKGARYNLAVPKYVEEAGVSSLSQLAKYKEKFHGKIYGVEPGNDGNRLIQKIISDNAFGLGSWTQVESSEQAMLMEVYRALKKKEWIIFLAWEPHPMNQKIQLHYLNESDLYFGPEQGSSTIYINTRKNYAKECPDVARFLKSFSLTVEIENTLIAMILEQKMEPKVAAKKWLQANLKKAEPWLSQVNSLDGQKGMSVLEKIESN